MDTINSLCLRHEDPLSQNPRFFDDLSAIDEALSQRELIDRVKVIDRNMVMQLFYVRKRIVGNPSLPNKLRITALEQLQATVAGLPNFILCRDAQDHVERSGPSRGDGRGQPLFLT